jgi:hypothetical protein
MKTLDWKKHDREIVDFVRRVTNFYLRTSATTGELLREDQGILLRNNYATPRLMGDLIDYLEHVTDQVDHKLSHIRTACLAAQMDLATCIAGSTTYMQIFGDYQSWVLRLDEYKIQTELALGRNPDASGDEDEVFWTNVTKPLILGWFPGADLQSKLDAVTPITLAWQIEVTEKAYADARTAFWKDLKQSAGEFYEKVTGFGAFGILLAITGLALGYGYAKGK